MGNSEDSIPIKQSRRVLSRNGYTVPTGLAHDGEVTFGVVAVAPGAASPGDGSAFGPRIAIAMIDTPAAIAGQFPSDRAAVPTHLSGDLGGIEALLFAGAKLYTPYRG